MKKIAIVCDSSVAYTTEQAKEYGVVIAPLTIIHNQKEYLDQVEMTHVEVNDLLRQAQKLQTSQPNLGLMIDIFTKLKQENYDHIFVLSIASSLSGTYAAFNQAIVEVGLDNVTLHDSKSIAGVVQHCVKLIHNMNAEGASIEAINGAIEAVFKNTESYVYPQTLDQLKVSGRISKGAALMASLLKVKPLLYLENGGATIEKLGTARTEAKIFEMIGDSLAKNNVTPQTHDIYYLENDGVEIVDRLKTYLDDRFGTFDDSLSTLPAVIATHAGLGTIVVQWVKKV